MEPVPPFLFLSLFNASPLFSPFLGPSLFFPSRPRLPIFSSSCLAPQR